jgi:hypothetical protein
MDKAFFAILIYHGLFKNAKCYGNYIRIKGGVGQCNTLLHLEF